jgi:environmental stress-induced protein Ves
MRLLDPAQYRRTPWKNGGGVTIDIADAYRDGAGVGDWNGMLWRFGRTRIERPGPFSDLTGYERLLAVIDGHGLALRLPNGLALDAQMPFRPVRFDGAGPIESALSHGPVGVLNLMADHARFTIDLVFPRQGEEIIVGPGVIVAWAASASKLLVDNSSVELDDDWSLRLDTGTAARIVCRNGRVAIATIATRAQTVEGAA